MPAESDVYSVNIGRTNLGSTIRNQTLKIAWQLGRFGMVARLNQLSFIVWILNYTKNACSVKHWKFSCDVSTGSIIEHVFLVRLKSGVNKLSFWWIFLTQAKVLETFSLSGIYLIL